MTQDPNKERGESFLHNIVTIPSGDLNAIANKYKLNRLLASGGEGHVYEASDLAGHEAAVKIYRQHHQGFFNALGRKARIAADLGQHPDIPTVYSFGEVYVTPHNPSSIHELGKHASRTAMTLEYFKGPSLRQYGPDNLPPYEAIRIISRLAEVLDYVHTEGYVHLDVKGGNVILPADQQPKLIDFGLIEEEGYDLKLHPNQMAPGTATYMSPEQDGPGPRTTAMDVYALGIELHRLLTGDTPRRDVNGQITETMERSLIKQGTPPDQIPQLIKSLQPLMEDMLSIDPTRRPSAKGAARKLSNFYMPNFTRIEDSTLNSIDSIKRSLRNKRPKPRISKPQEQDRKLLGRQLRLPNKESLQIADFIKEDQGGTLFRGVRLKNTGDNVLIRIYDESLEGLEDRIRPLPEVARHELTPNLIKVHFSGEAKFTKGESFLRYKNKNNKNKKHVIIMDYVEGPPLDQIELSPEEAIYIVREVAKTIAKVHDNGFTILSLLPNNIILKENGEPLICGVETFHKIDEWLSWFSPTLFMLHPLNTAPELCGSSIPQVEPSSSIYSLGALLSQLLTGDPPLRNTPFKEIYEANYSTETPELIRSITPIIDQSLSPDPRERPKINDFIAELNSYL